MAKYLYNGEKLPELPGWWDKSSFPVLFVHKVTGGSTLEEGVYLVAADKLGYITHPTDISGAVIDDSIYLYTLGGSDILGDQDMPISYVRWKSNGTEWEQVEIDLINNVYAGSEVVWSNATLRDADGNVLLEGSEPVPAPTFFLTSWLIGFALGIAGKPLPIALAEEGPAAYLLNGVLYIHDANAVLNDGMLEVT